MAIPIVVIAVISCRTAHHKSNMSHVSCLHKPDRGVDSAVYSCKQVSCRSTLARREHRVRAQPTEGMHGPPQTSPVWWFTKAIKATTTRAHVTPPIRSPLDYTPLYTLITPRQMSQCTVHWWAATTININPFITHVQLLYEFLYRKSRPGTKGVHINSYYYLA